MNDRTKQFNLGNPGDSELKYSLALVYDALSEKGYNPINQLVGYILSEDPTYITTHKNARTIINNIDRDELLQAMLKEFLAIKP